MANQIPIKVMCDGSGNTCGLAQFTSSDSVAIAAGGTGLTSQGICEFVQPGLYAVGCQVTYLGICAGKADTGVGHDNTYAGHSAGTAVTTGCQHTIIGSQAGKAITTCSATVAIGYSAGCALTFGVHNTLIGTAAGAAMTTKNNNTMIGYHAAVATNAGENVAVGACAMIANTVGVDNVAVGFQAGAAQVAAGCNNVFVGSLAGAVSLCRDNVSIGAFAGKAATTGGGNVMIGACVGYGVVGGASNVYIGDKAGLANTSGNANVFIGNCAGCATTGSCCLIIGNGACDLITGNFNTGIVSLDCVGIGTTAPLTDLEIMGPAADFGTLTLSTAETTIVATDPLGRLDFRAPLEASGSNAVLPTVRLEARAAETFDATNNQTDLLFMLACQGGVTEKLRITGEGDVGIGTTAPDVQVHVEAGTDTTTGTLPSARFERTGASQTGVVLRSNSIDGLILRADSAGLGAVSSYEDLAFYTGATPGSSYGTAHLRIETSGNIGIGGAVAAPDGLVHIMCASAGTETASTYGDLLVLEDDTDNGMTILTPDASYGQIIFQSPSASGAGISTANARFAAGYNGGAPRLDISVGATSNMMTWTSTGRIGIGTSVVSTGALLQLYNDGTEIDIQATAAAEAGRIRFRNTQGDWRVGVGAINGTGNFEALLTDGGGIGGFFINANGHMDLSNKSAGAYYGFHMDAKCTAQDNNTSWFVKLDDCVATRGYWYSDGDVWTADAGTLTSDQRLKTNIVDASPKLEDVMKLKVRNFEWIPEYHPAKVGEKKIGFIAQELETVFPSLISEHDVARNNEIQEVLYKEGDVIPSGKSVGDVKVAAKAHEPVMRKSYKSAFTPILVKALQELTLRVEALESSVT